MTIYRIWVISLTSGSANQLPQSKLIYTRHFPHLERRDCFTFPSITSADFLRSVFASLGIDQFSTTATPTATLVGTGGLRSSTMYGSNATLSSSAAQNSSFTADTSLSRMSTMSTGGGSSSHGSSGSLNSILSTATTNTTSTRGPGLLSSDQHPTFGDSSMTNTSALHNYLPLIVCRFMNSPRENAEEFQQQQTKLAYVDLLLLVFEKSGHLFLALPRLTSSSGHYHLNDVTSTEYYEQLLLEETNISLAYSALQLLATSFFAASKSVKSLEVVVSSCMPFGTLIKDGAELRSVINAEEEVRKKKDSSNLESDPAVVLRLVLNEFISTSFATSFSSSQAFRDQGETLFGTLIVEPGYFLASRLQQIGRAELKMGVENLGTFSVAKPPNCDTSSSLLTFDLKNCKLEPFNTLHFKHQKGDKVSGDTSFSSSSSPKSLPESGQNGQKLFTYRFKIAPRGSTTLPGNRTLSVLNSSPQSSNLQHLSLTLNFSNSGQRSPVDHTELKFAFFVVRFTFTKTGGKSQSGKQGGHQTTDSSSLGNLIVRESIRASFGQVRNENSNTVFSWIIGQRLPKSGGEFFEIINLDLL